MTRPEDDFGELRSALHAPATPANWRALCELLERWDPEGRTQTAIPYALGHLEQWPDDVRRVPCAWSEAIFRGDAHELLQLVTRFDANTSRPIEDAGAKLLSTTPWLDNLRILELENQDIDASGLRPLLQVLPALHTLSLSKNKLSEDAAKALTQSPLEQLRHLNLRNTQLNGRGLEYLWSAPWMQDLHHLNLSGNESVSPAGLEALSRQEGPFALRELFLDTCSIQWIGAKCLGDAAQVLPDLETLSLAHNSLTHDTVTALFRFVPWNHLQKLVLRSNWLGTTGVKLLASAKSLESLTSLELENNAIGSDGVRALQDLSALPHLRNLGLSSNNLGDEGARILANYEELAGLEELNLRRNSIGVEGIEALLKCPWRTNIRKLSLQNNPLGDDGFERLMRVEWPELTHLSLQYCNVTDASAAALARSRAFPRLERLDIIINFGETGKRALATSENFTPEMRAFCESFLG